MATKTIRTKKNPLAVAERSTKKGILKNAKGIQEVHKYLEKNPIGKLDIDEAIRAERERR